MYINGRCRTNLDDYDCSLVTKFVALPRVGDKVNVLKNGHPSTLKIVAITHTMFEKEPTLIVELHNR